jgi:hypothetical protein
VRMNGVTFFVPGVPPETEEEVYAHFASVCKRPVPAVEHRVYSITYGHDGIEWTVTVGETLTGRGRRTVRRGGKKVEQSTSHSDPATVRAIFAGVPYLVVTDGVHTRFANPFMAGEPRNVRYFGPKVRTAGSVSEPERPL